MGAQDKTRRSHIGLRARLTLTVSIVLLLTFLLIAYFLVHNAQNNDIRDINQGSRALANLATPQIGNTYDIYNQSGSIKIDQQIQSYTALDSNVIGVSIVNLDGKAIYQNNPNLKIEPVDKNNIFNTQYTYGSSGFISQILVPYFTQYGQHPYSIAYQINVAQLNADEQKQITDIILFSLFGLVATALVMYVIMTRFYIKPIEEIDKQAILISQGNYDNIIKLDRHDEIGTLANSVNTMAERLKADIVSLQQLDKMKSEFINITSHNLRTPLTIIKGNVELLQTKQLAEDVAKPIKGIADSSADLASLTEDMLTISSIEAGRQSVERTPTTFNDLTQSLKFRFTNLATSKGVNLEWKSNNPDKVFYISLDYTKSALKSLLDNAIKFTDKGGTVTCGVFSDDKELHLTVQDTGKGISQEEQADLFTKFHRLTSTLEYDYEGVGIGLYLAKLMVEAQHGSIRLESEPGKGSTFTITIPQQ